MIFQHIISHSYQRILFAECFPVLLNKCQPVDVRIYPNTQIVLAFFNFPAKLPQIFRDGLRVSGKQAIGLTVKLIYLFYPQRTQQHRYRDATGAVYRIHRNLEIPAFNQLDIY